MTIYEPQKPMEECPLGHRYPKMAGACPVCNAALVEAGGEDGRDRYPVEDPEPPR